jgi:integrase
MPSVDGKRPRNLLHSRLRTFFEWCAKPQIGTFAVSPMLGIDKPFNYEQRRESNWFKGAVGDQAIKTLWNVADKLPAVEGRYLKCLLLTGERKSALVEMKWEQIEQRLDGWF